LSDIPRAQDLKLDDLAAATNESIARQSLDAQSSLLRYALVLFGVGLAVLAWAASFAPDGAWVLGSFPIFAVNWAAFYAVMDWAKRKPAEHARLGQRIAQQPLHHRPRQAQRRPGQRCAAAPWRADPKQDFRRGRAGPGQGVEVLAKAESGLAKGDRQRQRADQGQAQQQDQAHQGSGRALASASVPSAANQAGQPKIEPGSEAMVR